MLKELADETAKDKSATAALEKIKTENADFIQGPDEIIVDEQEQLIKQLKEVKLNYQPKIRPLKDWFHKLEEQIDSESKKLNELETANIAVEKSMLPVTKPAKAVKPVKGAKGATAAATTAPVAPAAPRAYLEHAEREAAKLQ